MSIGPRNENSDPSDRELGWRSYELLFGHYETDLRLYWVRANFYLLVNGGLLAFATQNTGNIKAARTVAASERGAPGGSGGIPAGVLLGLCVLGVAVAILWLTVLKSSYAWVEQWRGKLTGYPWKDCGILRPPGAQAFESIAGKTAWVPDEPWRVKRPSTLSFLAPILFIGAWALLGAWVGIKYHGSLL